VIPSPTGKDSGDLARIYRVPLRSLKEGVDWREQVDHCLKNGIVGLGWGVPGDPPPTALEETFERIKNIEGWQPGSTSSGVSPR
jgi:hypothetical protein